METIKTWKIFFWLTPFYFDTSHFLTYAKISTHVNFRDSRHPRQNFMDPRHPRKISTHATHAFFSDLHQNFTDPRHTCHPCQSLTHATHASTLSTPPTLFNRLVWDYKNANARSIQKALTMIDRNKLYYNANVEIQVNILNDTLFNIFSNFVRSKVITVDNRDPPWINEEVRCKIKSKNKTIAQYLKNGRKITDFEIADCEAAELSEIIQNRREKYFSDLSLKLNNPQTSPKVY